MFLSTRLFFSVACLAIAIPATVRATVTVNLNIPNVGSMTLDLDEDSKPVTVANFLKYIRDGRYTNSFANRLPQGFVLQGGNQTYSAAGGFGSVSTFDPIVNEYSSGTVYSNIAGTIAMAKVDGDANSATSQWFINLGDNSSLDSTNGGFTVFGHVVTGNSVITQLQNFKNYDTHNPTDGTDLILHLIYDAPDDDLPVLSIVNGQFNFLNDLIYTTWTIVGGTKPVITSPVTNFLLKGTPFSYQIAATGNPTTFAVSGDPLPTGITLNPGSGLISGTPTDDTPVTLTITVSATGTSGTGSADFTIGYNYPVIPNGLSASGTVGQAFQYQISATNNPTSYSCSSLPGGLTLNATTGLISGTPTQSGSGNVTIQAGNAGGAYNGTLSLSIANGPAAPATVTTKKKVTTHNASVTLKGSASSSTVKVEIQPNKGSFKKAKGSPAKWTFIARGMKPGTYKFKIRATNSDGKITITPITVLVKY